MAQDKTNPANLVFSYKDVDTLRRYVSRQGTIIPREKTGLRSKQQKRLARAVKRARHLALMEFTQTV